MMELEVPCKQKDKDKEEQEAPFSLSKVTPGSRKAERKWHSRARSIPKAVIVRRSLLSDAVRILEHVNFQYGIGDAYLDDVFGRRVDVESGNRQLVSYLRNEGLEGSIQVKWSDTLSCTACMATSGGPRKLNKPHRRKYTLFLNSTRENMYLRAHGLTALANHEIGTHYVSYTYIPKLSAPTCRYASIIPSSLYTVCFLDKGIV